MPSLGNEYKTGTLSAALTALPGNHQEEFDRMLQRIKEIKHDFTMGELMADAAQKQPPAGMLYHLSTYMAAARQSDTPASKYWRLILTSRCPIPWMNTAIQMDGMPKTNC